MSKEELISELESVHLKLDIARTHNLHLKSALDGANTQMVLQYLHVRQLDRIRVPELRPARYTFFPGGKGLELTSEPVLVSIRARNDAADEERLAKEARRKVGDERRAGAAVLIARKNAATAAWEREKARAKALEADWRRNGSPRGLKPSRRQMKDVQAPYLAGELVIEEVALEDGGDNDERGGQNSAEEPLEEIELASSESSESEEGLGSDDDDYQP